MREILPNLWIGDLDDCAQTRPENNWSILHACKTCHQVKLEYRGSLAIDHPHYLYVREPDELWLNMVDAANPNYFPLELFQQAISFIKRHLDHDTRVLVHCNQGHSRAAGIVIAYLASLGEIRNDSFDLALVDYRKLDDQVALGLGLAEFLKRDWDKVIRRGR